MNPEELFAHMSTVFAKCIETAKLKNADYSGSNISAFKNFRLVEEAGLTSTEIGIGVRLTDKLSRMCTLLKGAKPNVVDEKLEDTIEDAINYLAILHAYLTFKNKILK